MDMVNNPIENSKSKRTHVLKRDSGWAVKKEGAQKASRIFKTKEEAIKNAQKQQTSEKNIVIHKEDGSVQKWLRSRDS